MTIPLLCVVLVQMWSISANGKYLLWIKLNPHLTESLLLHPNYAHNEGKIQSIINKRSLSFNQNKLEKGKVLHQSP